MKLSQFNSLILSATLMTSLVFSPKVFSEEADAATKGLTISKESKTRDLGWGDTQAKMEMLLKNQQIN